MNYAWNREPELHIRSAHQPTEGEALSGVVLVYEQGVGRAYIKFEQDTLDKLGKKVPYGIGPGNPGYVKAVKKHGHYDIVFCYLDKSKTVPLWRSDKLPNWIKRVHHPQAV